MQGSRIALRSAVGDKSVNIACELMDCGNTRLSRIRPVPVRNLSRQREWQTAVAFRLEKKIRFAETGRHYHRIVFKT